MSVLPPKSHVNLPPILHNLSTRSEITDFYPNDFESDLNGRRFAWQATTKLPFINEKRLFAVYKAAEPHFPEDHKKRNLMKPVMMFQYVHTSLDCLFIRKLTEVRSIETVKVHCIENPPYMRHSSRKLEGTSWPQRMLTERTWINKGPFGGNNIFEIINAVERMVPPPAAPAQ